jgi:hypothetical protein
MSTLIRCVMYYLTKGDDYANADRLSNFKMAGQIAGGNAQLNCLKPYSNKGCKTWCVT